MIAELRAGSGAAQIVALLLEEISKPAGLILVITGLLALAYIGRESVRLPKTARQRMWVVLILTFFSMLFWSFFEQAGSSINNFTDRNVDRVREQRVIGADDVGRTLRIQPTQEQLGHQNGARLFTMDDLNALRARQESDPGFAIEWRVAPDNVGMGVAERDDEVPASVFQSTNPILILLFGLLFTALWSFLGQRGVEPSTPFKFALALLQLGLGFGAIWYGAQTSDERGMVAVSWLLLGYLLHTTGELCLSPVGLSMITRLSPKQLVSTVMGMWFLATAFSQYLAAIISQLTGVGHGGGDQAMPVPRETVHVYGDVFGDIALAAIVSAAVCFALVPLLKRWMHEEEEKAA
jgi:proton-dependent oligopeptide transporter, POT family